MLRVFLLLDFVYCMQEAFYDERTNTGILVNKIKNNNREKHGTVKMGRLTKEKNLPDSGPATSTGAEDALSDEQRKELQGDVNWLKFTSKRVADDDVVKTKMQKTLPLRQEMVREGVVAGTILEKFPKYKEQPGLVSILCVNVTLLKA